MADSVDINFPMDISRGLYSNLALITHSNNEFILDFAQALPGLPKPTVGSRIIMTPEHAKRLLAALNDNVAKYEATFGPIKINNPQGNVPPMGFGGGMA